MRDEHCAFARLNTQGKCVAPCWYTKGRYETDCTGKSGGTKDMGREVQIPMSTRVRIVSDESASKIEQAKIRKAAEKAYNDIKLGRQAYYGI